MTGSVDPTLERLASEHVTPMMRQYLGVKAEYPGAIVLFRMGDFFETFYEDAEECSRILDLTLTARSKERDVKMAGVPAHAIDGYLQRLIEAGRTVVMVDQVEDPKQAKGLVRRAVTRVLSPGTYFDLGVPARQPSYLAAVVFEDPSRGKKREGFGLAALDLSTGEFRATGGAGVDVLVDELVRLGMREIVWPEALRSDERVSRVHSALPKVSFSFLDPRRFPVERARDALVTHFGKDEIKGLATALSEESLTAAGLALRYGEESQIRPEAPDVHGRATLAHIRALLPYEPGSGLILDADARDHLELFEAHGDLGKKATLLGAIDEAKTGMGGRLLVRWLAYPLRDLTAIRARQECIAAFVARQGAMDRVREALHGVGDIERLIARVVLARANPRDLVALSATLRRAPDLLAAAADAARASSALEGVVAPRLASLASTDPAFDVADRIEAALVPDPTVDLETGPIFREGHDAELDRLSDLAKNGKQLIAALEQKEKERTGISSLKIRYNRVFGYYLEVTRANLKLVPKDYVRKQTTVGSERFYTEELKALETDVLSADEQRLTRTIALYQRLIGVVAAEVARLNAVSAAMAELDVLSGLAWLADRRGWVRPEVDDSGTIEIVEGRHPVIELFTEGLGERFVPNDLVLTPKERLMIITGPNMAGKSTIMRQTALIVILAHMGAFVPAKSARIGLCDRVYTRVGASDDLARGRSTFMVEMNETARILRSATADSLILLDEIGRGTSTFDGLSIAWAVAEHLHDVVKAKTLFATHYHELTEISRDKPHAVLRHVAVREWNDKIVFLRKLVPGATNRSYGVQVARLAGLPKPVIDRARAVLDTLEAQALESRSRSTDQLALFAAKPAETPAPADSALSEKLRALSIDDLTPRQALEILAELQKSITGD